MTEREEKILARFEEISRIPRCSKNEAGIRQWLIDWAVAAGFEHRTDGAGNLVVRVPSSPGCEDAPLVVLQGHMDMVCEKTPESDHDFSRDPLRLHRNGEWITADRTTLGADNGIALALAMVASEDDTLTHPALELLFTVDEESGLTGADQLDPSIIRGRVLLNLDSEDEGVFTIGCAGGEELLIDLPIEREAEVPKDKAHRIQVGGLRGGHSGIDIQKPRENAVRLLTRIVAAIIDLEGVRLAAATGGSAHNAIARDAEAVVWCTESGIKSLEDRILNCRETFLAESRSFEPGLEVRLTPASEASPPREPLTAASAALLLRLLQSIPHGVARMSADVDGLVETSCNLAVVKTKADTVHVTTSQRSSIASRLDELGDRIRSAAALAGAAVKPVNRYPAWQPDLACPLLARCKAVYQNLFGADPVVEIIHAGLECGIIGDKVPGMRMISFGPTIRNPHSPEEALHVPSVVKIYDFLAALLAALGDSRA